MRMGWVLRGVLHVCMLACLFGMRGMGWYGWMEGFGFGMGVGLGQCGGVYIVFEDSGSWIMD